MPVIRVRHSTVTGHVPSSLAIGELALNTADGVLFWLDFDLVTIRSYNFKFPRGPNPDPAENSTRLATTAFVQAAVAAFAQTLTNFVGNAPTNMDTLGELAAALGNDPQYSTTQSNKLLSFLRFDQPQTINPTQRAQARDNLQLLNYLLRYDVGQILTGPQQAQVRDNLNLLSYLLRYDTQQTLTGGQQAQVRSNLGIVPNTLDNLGNLWVNSYFLNSAQNISSGVFTRVQLLSPNNVVVPPYAGWYLAIGTIQYGGDISNGWIVALTGVNGLGAQRNTLWTTTANTQHVQSVAIHHVNGTSDWIELDGFSNGPSPNFAQARLELVRLTP